MPKPDALLLPDPSPQAQRALETATALVAAGELRRARALALPLLGEPALHVHALVLLTDVARRLGETAEAARLASRAARLAPQSARALALCAMALTEAGRHEAALDKAQAALARDADERLALAARLLAASRLGEAAGAREAALGLLAVPECPTDFLLLAASVLDSLAAGHAWGRVACRDGALAGVVRQLDGNPTRVALRVDGKPVARITATTPVCPQAGLLGFRLPPPDGLTPGAVLEVVFDADDTPLDGSPVVLPAPAPANGTGPGRGSVACDADGRLVGHLFDPARPLARGRVALVAEGEETPRRIVTADAFDQRLLEKGYGDGRCAFAVDWPHDDGVACRTVHVRDAATGAPLSGSPVLVPHPALAGPALAGLVGWLRRAGESPDAPPPLPPACRGALVNLAREALAERVARLDARSLEPDAAGDAHA